MKLIIAEKPIAAKRIADILGKPKALKKNGVEYYSLDDSLIVPMKGHILNVDFSKDYKDWSKTDLGKLIDAELYYEPTQESIVKTIKGLASKCDVLLIATDYDNEGESIGKEAIILVKEKSPNVEVKRAKFSALTQKEVTSAFDNLTDFDYNLADSADARREVDLIWGAVLTRYISLASKRLGKRFLSVGRVQTPTLALVIEREKEIKAFKPKPFWSVFITCIKDKESFEATYEEEKIFDKKEAERVSLLSSDKAIIKEIDQREITIKPPAPFNTTEFLRAASNIGYQPHAALSIAESLYMKGLVSYPRTDNTVYPPSIDLRHILEKLSKSPELGELAKKLLAKKQLKPTKGKRFATDHPPIHPVDVADKKKLSRYEWKIYELVVHRFFATLSDNSIIDSLRVILDYAGENFIARGSTILKPGWREFYPYSKHEEKILPKFKEKEILDVEGINSREDETKPKPRYTPAALIKKMEDLGLGTKATRAEMLQKLSARGYVIGRKNFTPSHVAIAVIDTLHSFAPDITKPEMTANLEKEMELVEKGEEKKEEVVSKSRKILHGILDKLETHKEEVGAEVHEAVREDMIVGKCPKCDGNMRMIFMRKGTRFIGCSSYPKCHNSYPLPRMGMIQVIGKECKDCGLPTIRVIRKGKRPYEMCIDPKCPSKADWGKKKPKKKTTKKKTKAKKTSK